MEDIKDKKKMVTVDKNVINNYMEESNDNIICFKDFTGRQSFKAILPVKKMKVGEFEKYLNVNNTSNILEYYENDRIVKPYYDIDSGYVTEEELLEKKDDILEQVLAVLSVTFPLGCFAVSSSHGFKNKRDLESNEIVGSVFALSFHVVVNNYQTNVKELKQFNLENDLYNRIPHCDESVYKKAGMMRCVFSNKPLDERKKLPHDWKNEPLKHIIQSNKLTNKEFHPLILNNKNQFKKKKVIKKKKVKKVNDKNIIVKDDGDEKDDFVIVDGEKDKVVKKKITYGFSDMCKTLLDIKHKWLFYKDIIEDVSMCFFNCCKELDELDSGFSIIAIWIKNGEDVWRSRPERTTDDYNIRIKEEWKYWRERTNNPTEKLMYGSLVRWAKESKAQEIEEKEKDPHYNKYKEAYLLGNDEFMELMNKNVMYYEVDGSFLYYGKRKQLLNHNEKTLINFFAEHSFIFENDKGKEIKINPFKIWLESKGRKTISEIVFKPNHCDDFEVEDYQLNLWKGFDYKNTGKYDINKIQHILDHIKEIWASNCEITYDYFIGWFAQILQTPWKKTKMCVGLKSIEGVGKSMILDLFAVLMGEEYYMTCTDLEKVIGKFNVMAKNKLLIDFNETSWGGDKKMKGKFKNFITDKTVTIEPKGKDPYDIACLSNCFITTNEPWLVDIKGDTRRFNLRECMNKLYDESYYEKIYNFKDFQDLANFFYNYDLSKFDAKVFEKSDLMLEQVILSQDSIELFIHQIVERDIILSKNDNNILIEKSIVYDYYLENTKGKYNDVVHCVHFWRKVKIILPSLKFKTANKSNRARIHIENFDDIVKDYRKYTGQDKK